MKADVQYNDFKGTVAADISDSLGAAGSDDLKNIGRYFNLDETRFKIVGLSIYGTNYSYISMVCVDLEKSTETKEHIVNMSVEVKDEKEILKIIFKRLHIVLHDKYDTKYPSLGYDEEKSYSYYHNE